MSCASKSCDFQPSGTVSHSGYTTLARTPVVLCAAMLVHACYGSKSKRRQQLSVCWLLRAVGMSRRICLCKEVAGQFFEIIKHKPM